MGKLKIFDFDPPHPAPSAPTSPDGRGERSVLTSPTSAWQKILAASRYFLQLDVILKQYLEPSLVKHCQVAHYANGRLAIAVSNAVWATQLRYQVPDLLALLRNLEQFRALRTIHVFVRMDLS